MSDTIEPGPFGIAVGALSMAAMLLLARLRGFDLLRKGLWAATRAALQLFAVGLVLDQTFTMQSGALVLTIIAIMSMIAGATAASQIPPLGHRAIVQMTLILGTVTSGLLAVGLWFALGVPGFPARYAVPLGGILLGNALTAATLAANRYLQHLSEHRAEIETALGLGATPRQADQRARTAAFSTAVTPVLNAMMVVGVVKLPGMMSGQMLGGSSPQTAAQYQLLVLFLLAAGDGLSALWTLTWLQRRAFNRAWQLQI